MRAFLLATLLLAAPLAALCQEGGDNNNQAPTAEAPAAECDNPFDKEMQDRYSNFFLVLRLLNYYTLDDPQTPGPSLDLSQTNGMPVTVMVPTNDAMNDFLKCVLAAITY
jgi:hypothetical protein